MHKTPAILFGDADFHHFCGRVEAAEQFKDVLPQVLLLFNNPHGAFGG
jgi:hypothetical protein